MGGGIISLSSSKYNINNNLELKEDKIIIPINNPNDWINVFGSENFIFTTDENNNYIVYYKEDPTYYVKTSSDAKYYSLNNYPLIRCIIPGKQSYIYFQTVNSPEKWWIEISKISGCLKQLIIQYWSYANGNYAHWNTSTNLNLIPDDNNSKSIEFTRLSGSGYNTYVPSDKNISFLEIYNKLYIQFMDCYNGGDPPRTPLIYNLEFVFEE